MIEAYCPVCYCKLNYNEEVNFGFHPGPGKWDGRNYQDNAGHPCPWGFRALRLVGNDYYHSTQTNSNMPENWERVPS